MMVRCPHNLGHIVYSTFLWLWRGYRWISLSVFCDNTCRMLQPDYFSKDQINKSLCCGTVFVTFYTVLFVDDKCLHKYWWMLLSVKILEMFTDSLLWEEWEQVKTKTTGTNYYVPCTFTLFEHGKGNTGRESSRLLGFWRGHRGKVVKTTEGISATNHISWQTASLALLPSSRNMEHLMKINKLSVFSLCLLCSEADETLPHLSSSTLPSPTHAKLKIMADSMGFEEQCDLSFKYQSEFYYLSGIL